MFLEENSNSKKLLKFNSVYRYNFIWLVWETNILARFLCLETPIRAVFLYNFFFVDSLYKLWKLYHKKFNVVTENISFVVSEKPGCQTLVFIVQHWQRQRCKAELGFVNIISDNASNKRMIVNMLCLRTFCNS